MAAALPIFTFHSLEDNSSVLSFSPRLFERSMTRLHGIGYRTARLPEIVEGLRRGAPFPDRSFVLTFDDGYHTVYGEAFPILQRHNMSATVFLTVGAAGATNPDDRLPSLYGRSMLSWREVREMQQAGISFGAHTCTHPNLIQLGSEDIDAEVSRSKAILQDRLGVPVDSFAYPFGRYDQRSREIVQRHFACACSDKLGLITASSDPYTLERVETYYFRSDRLMGLTSSRLFPWYIQARKIPRQLRRAVRDFQPDATAERPRLR